MKNKIEERLLEFEQYEGQNAPLRLPSYEILLLATGFLVGLILGLSLAGLL